MNFITLRSTIKFLHVNKTKFTTMSTENHWRGVHLSEIHGSQSPWGSPEFPLVTPSFNHCVLYHIPSNGCIAADRPPKPQIGQDKWDSEHVRMPCSSHSLYPVKDNSGEKQLKKRWEIIESALSKPIKNTRELADTILSYNTKFKGIWRFCALHKLFEEYLDEEVAEYFFTVTLPEIAKLALSLPKLIQAPIPMLKQHKNRSLSLSQHQISSLLANAFFCTFPRRNTTKRDSEYANYPHINFNALYESTGCDSVLEKLKCICHYFRRVCTKVPSGVVTFSRRSVPPKNCPEWHSSEAVIGLLPIHVDSTSTIEDAHGLVQVDFANRYLGGGVIGHGCVQEEIRFVICPELLASMLFTEVLRPNEAFIIIGPECYSNYTGYGNSFQFSGDHRDETPRDSSGRFRCSVLAIDALPYSSVVQEYRKENITRELNKAWVGFSFYTDEQPSLQYPGVATGNWGCGAFGGSPQLKSLIQIMALTQVRRPMAYYTFGDSRLRDEIVAIYNLLQSKRVTVGQLYKYVIRFTTTDVRKTNLNSFLRQVLRDEELTKSVTIDMDKMETSTTSNINENDLSESMQEELLNESPDLFSQDDNGEFKSESVTPNIIQTKDVMDISNENKMAPDIDMAEGKMAENNMADSKVATNGTNQTSRLFDEMHKLDEENGKLNLNDTNNSIILNTSLNDDNNLQTNVSLETKKRMSKKITDYFCKKPI